MTQPRWFSHTHTIMLAPSPECIILWEEREVRVPGVARGEKETKMRGGGQEERGVVIANERYR